MAIFILKNRRLRELEGGKASKLAGEEAWRLEGWKCLKSKSSEAFKPPSFIASWLSSRSKMFSVNPDFNSPVLVSALGRRVVFQWFFRPLTKRIDP